MSNKLVYWESQESELCAIHCLNSLLQGPYFTEIDLSSIGQQFDEQERQLMLESGMNSKSYLDYIANDSENVGNSGNFSIQVISAALKNMNIDVGNYMFNQNSDPNKEKGFIFNLESHWFSVRKINNNFYNLDSTAKGPSYVSDFYLHMISQLLQESYSIFVVNGDFPSPMYTESSFGHIYQIDIDGSKLIKISLEKLNLLREEKIDLCSSMLLSIEEPIEGIMLSISFGDDDLEYCRKFNPSDSGLLVMYWIEDCSNHELFADEMKVMFNSGSNLKILTHDPIYTQIIEDNCKLFFLKQ